MTTEIINEECKIQTTVNEDEFEVICAEDTTVENKEVAE